MFFQFYENCTVVNVWQVQMDPHAFKFGSHVSLYLNTSLFDKADGSKASFPSWTSGPYFFVDIITEYINT